MTTTTHKPIPSNTSANFVAVVEMYFYTGQRGAKAWDRTSTCFASADEALAFANDKTVRPTACFKIVIRRITRDANDDVSVTFQGIAKAKGKRWGFPKGKTYQGA
jgi:hypothetical protein